MNTHVTQHIYNDVRVRRPAGRGRGRGEGYTGGMRRTLAGRDTSVRQPTHTRLTRVSLVSRS